MGSVKVIRCSDAGFDCDAVFRSESEEELMAQVAAHAKEAHNLTEITDEVVQKVKSIMKVEV